MSRIFRMCISVLLLALLFFPSNLVADASRESSAAKVKVELPKFQVRLNGEKNGKCVFTISIDNI